MAGYAFFIGGTTMLGANIEVDLLLKPNDQTVKLVQQGIDRIDTHVPERFTRDQLEAALGVKRG